MMGVKSLPRLLLIYSIVVLVLLILIASNVDREVRRLRREEQGVHRGTLKIREGPVAAEEQQQQQQEHPQGPPVGLLPANGWQGDTKTSTGSNVDPSASSFLGDGQAHHLCHIVHLAFVVTETRSLVTEVLKSVLIHRRCPLHLHFITDSFNQSVLEKLMDTWELPYVEHSFYTTDYIKQNLTLRSSILSGDVLRISLLLLPYVLPKTIDNVIVLGSNLLVVSDVQELWGLALKLNEQEKLFAVSKATSALQGFFDTSVVIMNLKFMRASNWDQQWQSVVKNSPNSDYTSHDVINSVISAYPDAMLVLPCLWNVNGQSQLTCSNNATDYRILLLDSSMVASSEGSDSYATYLAGIMSTVKKYSSPDLKITPPLCDKSGVTENKHTHKLPNLPRRSRREMCRLITNEQKRTFITHLYYYGQKYIPSDNFETTLVTQLSLDRLDKFRLLLNHWDGPMSISMYGTDAQAWNLTKFLDNEGVSRDNLIIHIVYQQGRFYPVNHLRNLALESVTTPYMFLSDADFLPSFGLFTYLKGAIKALTLASENKKKKALIIPAFNGEEGFIYPSSKEDLQQQLKEGSIRMFCVWCAHQTHGQTNYTVWATATQPYKVEWAFHFEPYVVVDRNAPKYDERFVGYGWNKVSQITELKAQKYEFIVLPNVYTIHSPHKRTTDREIWKRKNYKFCINSLWKKFIQELLQKYGPDSLSEEKLLPVMLDVEI